MLYIDNAVINELKSKALPRLLTRVNRAGHGWGDIGINVMEQYYIDELNHMLNEGYVRIIEDDKALEVQRRALKNRPTRRVCWKDEVMDQLLDKIPSEDIDVVNSLLYAYDLLATVPRRGGPGITTGRLVFITNDKELRSFVENDLSCAKCPCKDKVIVLDYDEFKARLKQAVSSMGL